MKPLFKAETELTYKELKRFIAAVIKENFKFIEMAAAVLLVIFFMGVMTYLRGFSGFALCAVVFILLFLVLLANNLFFSVKKAYKKLEKSGQLKFIYEFYDNEMRVLNNSTDIYLKYSDIYKIIETKYNFYILTSVNQGYILIKSGFEKGLSEFIKKLETQAFNKPCQASTSKALKDLNGDEEALFTVNTKIDFNEYKRFSRYILFKRRGLLYTSVFVILAVEIGIFMFWQYYSYALMFAFIAVFFAALIYLPYRAREKEYYRSNKQLKEKEFVYLFFENRFVGSSEGGLNECFYKDVYKIAKTKTNIYILISKGTGFILLKKNCPDGLVTFLKNKVKK